MVRVPVLLPELAVVPFRGSDAIGRGLLTKAQLRGRSWRRLFPDVYVHASVHDPEDHRMWCDAAALVLPSGGAIDGLSASYLWGVNLLARPASVSVCVPRNSRPRRFPRLTFTRTALLPEDVTSFGGIPLTTPLRTTFDLGCRRSRTEALVVVDALCHKRVVTPRQLSDYAIRRPGWPGSRQLHDVLSLARPLAESPMETRLRLLLHDAGAPPLTPQYEVRDNGRLIGRVDLAYPQWRIAIEYEGDHHRGRATFRRDVTRYNDLRALGWLVLRFTADDVLRQPRRVVELVAAAVRERR